jgi:hypothetical protein
MVNLKGRGQTDQDIIRACGYITDDKFIASYFGVDIKRVSNLRVEVNKAKAKTKQATVKPPKVSSINWNSDAERKAIRDAKEGSAALLKALEKFFINRRYRMEREQST